MPRESLAAAGSVQADYLAAWGDNFYGQCNVPAGNNYIAVAAGWYHSLAVRSDGSLAAWGDNTYGQCDVPAGSYTAVTAGGWHSLALTTVPEPSGLLALVCGLGGIGVVWRRRR